MSPAEPAQGPWKGPGGVDGLGAIEAVAREDVRLDELTRDALGRVDQWEPRLGAITEVVGSPAGRPGPISGMILGIKNQIDVAGVRNWWTIVSPATAAPPDQDAPVVARLRDAGGTIFCTTEAPFLGAPGGVTPQTLNPRCPDRVSGGSSGGSAATVAAGLVHAAMGTDSGGSIRIPAACCGVVGLQSTRGLIPLLGTGGLTHSIGTVGPIAASVADCRKVFEVVAGFEADDPYSVKGDRVEVATNSSLRLGIPTELVRHLDDEVARAFDDLVSRLMGAGHRVERFSLPWIDEAMDLGPRTLGIVESGTIIADMVGDRPSAEPAWAEAVLRAQAVPGPQLVQAQHRVAQIRMEMRQVFDEYDLLMTPTLPCRVPAADGSDREDEIVVGGVTETRTAALTRLVNPWNLAGLPAGTLPIARDVDEAPVSAQVIGPAFSDWSVLDFMELIEGAVGGPWDTVPPGNR